MIDVVLLDIDGTLVDSNDAHAQAWVDAAEEAGFPVEFAHVRRLIGMGGDKVLPELTGLSDDEPRGKALSERRTAIFEARYLPRLRAFPDARRLLEALRARGLRFVVATSAKADEADALLEVAGVADLVTKRTSSDDADDSKPDPDIVHAALKRAKVSPDRALMLGDTPYDVEAAERAGVATVAFRCGGWGDRDLHRAVAIYDDPSDLLRNLDASPFARESRRPTTA